MLNGRGYCVYVNGLGANRLTAIGAAVILALAIPASSCGPSVQSIHEGSVRFEHCYSLDLDREVSGTHRMACWKEWTSHYTYGQSRDRIEYARRRIRALAMGDPSPPTLNMNDETLESEQREFYLSVPAPTSAHAPPPPIATRHNVRDAGAPPRTVPAAPAPGDECAVGCRQNRAGCYGGCTPDGGTIDKKDANRCRECDADYKRCMARCFK